MNFDQITYFIAIAEFQSMSRAAEQLHITQPALSRSLAKLEASVGATLFTRNNGYMELTESGKKFQLRAKKALSELEQGCSDVAHFYDEWSREISIGVTNSTILSKPLTKFLLENSNMHVRHYELVIDAIVQELNDKIIDFAVTTTPIAQPGMIWEFLVEDELYALVSNDSSLAHQPQVSIADICSQELVIGRVAEHTIETLINKCSAIGIRPKIRYQGVNDDISIQLAQNEDCVLLIPSAFFRQNNSTNWKTQFERYGLQRVSTTEKIVSDPVGIVTMRNQKMRVAPQLLIDYLRNYIGHHRTK